jgi:hypothetical protein
VSGWGDHVSGMSTQTLDDASVEAVLTGRPVPGELEGMTEAVELIRSVAQRPVRPSPELAELLVTGRFRASRRCRVATGTTLTKLSAMSLRVKVATGIAAGLSGLTGVAAAGEISDAVQESVAVVQEGVASAVEMVIPIDLAKPKASVDAAEDAPAEGGFPAEVSKHAHEVDSPVVPSPQPSTSATPAPSPTPTTESATPQPSESPTPEPTPTPTAEPTSEPTSEPSSTPTPTPTEEPTPDPAPSAPAEAGSPAVGKGKAPVGTTGRALGAD